MIDVEKIKSEVLEEIKKEDLETAMWQFMELMEAILGVLSEGKEKSDKPLDYMKDLYDFYEMGRTADPRSFIGLQQGAIVTSGNLSFEVIKVLNEYSCILKHNNISMKFIVMFSFDIDALSLGFEGDAYIYDDDGKMIGTIPYELIKESFSR